MKSISMKVYLSTLVFSILFVSISVNFANAETIPEWVKNNALWYGQGVVSETEFLNAIKFLIENDIIVIENKVKQISEKINAIVEIPNGNFNVSGSAFYRPLNLEIKAGTTVTWVNEDSVPHTIQSQDEFGKIIGLFNSAPLETGEKFEYTFEEIGVYNYYCSLHPWRVGLITVT